MPRATSLTSTSSVMTPGYGTSRGSRAAGGANGSPLGCAAAPSATNTAATQTAERQKVIHRLRDKECEHTAASPALGKPRRRGRAAANGVISPGEHNLTKPAGLGVRLVVPCTHFSPTIIAA